MNSALILRMIELQLLLNSFRFTPDKNCLFLAELLILWHEPNYLRAKISNELLEELKMHSKNKTIMSHRVVVRFSCVGVLRMTLSCLHP